MFPTLEFKVYGLKPEATYEMYVDMVLVDVNQWKFNSGQWIPSGQVEQCQKTSQTFEKYPLKILFDYFRSSSLYAS
jgi:T-box protein 1